MRTITVFWALCLFVLSIPYIVQGRQDQNKPYRLSMHQQPPANRFLRPDPLPAVEETTSANEYPPRISLTADNHAGFDEMTDEKSDPCPDSLPSPTTPTRNLVSPRFESARIVSFLNMLLFAFRPDPDVTWPSRIPRILWEFVVLLNAQQAGRVAKNGSLPSIFYVWFAFLTGSTGLVDLFLWAPLYGSWVSFETCEGGWFQPKICRIDPFKGYSRLAVAVQAVVGGMVYLYSAVEAMHVLHLRKEEDKRQQREELLLRARMHHRPVLPRPSSYRR